MLRALRRILKPLRHWKELPLRELTDRPATSAAPPARIPPIVVQTWEDRRFGKTHLREMARFRELNPELSFELWDREQRLAYLRTNWGHHPIHEIYEKALFGPMKADIFRYCLMADRGGFYFDISKGCSAPLRSLYSAETEALITFEPHDSPTTCDQAAAAHLMHPGKLLLQWGFGFAPRHPIPLRTIENICAEYPRFRSRSFASPKDAIRELTGPVMFTRSVREVFAAGPLPNVVQAGIDFNGFGLFALAGSNIRYITVPSYIDARNRPIVS